MDGSLRFQEEHDMSFDVGPLQGASVSHLTPRSTPAQPVEEGSFAKVYDLAKVRRGAPDVPMAVWDEVDRAAQVAGDLEAAGRSVRFTASEDGGRVRAELVDASGNVLRPISLGEIVTIGTTDPPTAA
jgi:hypothetical protein